MSEKIISIIPARGRSKGLPRKNIVLLNGKPLIAYSIESALKSRFISRVIVSTEDAEITEISKKYGSEVINRPNDLAQDDSPTISVVINALQVLAKEGYFPNIVILLQPTTPLRTYLDIDAALELFMTKDCQSVISVSEIDHSPYWSFAVKKGYLESLFDKKYQRMRRQDLPKIYLPNGALFISRPERLCKTKSFYSTKTLPYMMPRERSIDIDDEMDLLQAENLLKRSSAQIA